MAELKKILFIDKENKEIDITTPVENKVTAADLNEIKNVVNSNFAAVDLEVTSNTELTGTNAAAIKKLQDAPVDPQINKNKLAISKNAADIKVLQDAPVPEQIELNKKATEVNKKGIDDNVAAISSLTLNVGEQLKTKQDVLTAGTNITITDNVISAAGGGEPVDAIFKTGEKVKEVDYLGLINQQNLNNTNTFVYTNEQKIIANTSEIADNSTLINNNKEAVLLNTADIETNKAAIKLNTENITLNTTGQAVLTKEIAAVDAKTVLNASGVVDNKTTINQVIEELHSAVLFNYKGDWTAGEYVAGDVVSKGIILYLAKVNTTQEPTLTATEWAVFSASSTVDLNNYYMKSETYSKDETDAHVGAVYTIATGNTGKIADQAVLIETNKTAIATKAATTYVDEALKFTSGVNIGAFVIASRDGALGVFAGEVPANLYGADPVNVDDFTTKQYVDAAVGSIPVGESYELITAPAQTEDNPITTKLQYSLTGNVNTFKAFRVTVKSFSEPQGIRTVDIMNDASSYGKTQSTNNNLEGSNGTIIVEWVNVAGNGGTPITWLYTNGAIQSIFGIKGPVLRTARGKFPDAGIPEAYSLNDGEVLPVVQKVVKPKAAEVKARRNIFKRKGK